MDKRDIRVAALGDVARLTNTFDTEYQRTHADDVVDNTKLFLVAWVNEVPAGHVLVHWPGPRQPEPLAAFPDCPEIHRLSVLGPFQRRGIATALIARCELEAQRKGYARIGLGTDPELSVGDNLYYRLGYQDSGIGEFDDCYQRVNDAGDVITIAEPTTFLIKQL